MGCSFRSGSNGRSCFIEKDEIKIAVIVFIFFRRDFLRSPPGHSLPQQRWDAGFTEPILIPLSSLCEVRQHSVTLCVTESAQVTNRKINGPPLSSVATRWVNIKRSATFLINRGH